jgi:hypothetical protein
MNKIDQTNSTFLTPRFHTYTPVNTTNELNVGVLYASKKIFDLGVKYVKDMAITIATAEMTILTEASLTTIDHFFDKLNEKPEIKEFIHTNYSKIMGLFESSINIVRFMAYHYLTKSWNNFATTNKSYMDINGNLTPDGNGFQKMLEFVSNTSNNNKNGVTNKNGGGITKEDNDKMYSALRIVDRLTNDLMKLPQEIQQDKLLKITDVLKTRMNNQMGGRFKRVRKNTKKFRVIRKMIKRSMRRFSKPYHKLP